MPLLQQAVFHTTVAHLRDLPTDARVEVAFAGRSNAGKSSAINTLANHVRLAYVSKTPGRTQHLNYFTLGEGRYLVDLPGYGYAKAPLEIRAQWEGLVGPYLQMRSPLAGLVLIMDARHPLTDLDRRMIAWVQPSGKPIHVLLSKSDKLSRQQSTNTLRTVQKALAEMGDEISVQLFSSLKKTGIDEAEVVLGRWLGMEPVAKKKPPANSGGKQP
ncbi:MAG: ribosome biosis GTP-binding protein YsxC/EngB [Proteobacteria bacterium]|nr:ribosome biosis GTP-binding protein YsxC/EngB [Pseudomonadota bacterium]